MAARLFPRWIEVHGRFGWALTRALGTSMVAPTLLGLLTAAGAPVTAALLEAVVRRSGGGTAPVGLALGLIIVVVAHRSATWAVTVLLRRRCELADSAISRCLTRRAMATAEMSPQFSINLVAVRYPEILAQYVFLAVLPGNVLAVAALLGVAVHTTGPAAAGAALVGVAVVLAIGYGLNALESRAAYAVERGEAHRTRLMALVLTRRPTLVRQSLGRQVMAAFDIARTPQVQALRRRVRAAATTAALWGSYELLALLAALGGLALIGGLGELGPALTLLVIVRLIGAEVTRASTVLSCLQDARPVLAALRTDWFAAPTPTAAPELTALTQPERRLGTPPSLPPGARALVVGSGDVDLRAVLRRLATTCPSSTLLVTRDRPLVPGTVRSSITLAPDTDHDLCEHDVRGRRTSEDSGDPDALGVDERRYRSALAASGLAESVRAWPEGDTRRVGVDDGLSDGERVRIQLAQALYWRPEVLVIDDAFAALDPTTATTAASAVLGAGPGRVLFTTTRRELAAWADHLVVLTDPAAPPTTDTSTDSRTTTGTTISGAGEGDDRQPDPADCRVRVVPAAQVTARDIPAQHHHTGATDPASGNPTHDLLTLLRDRAPAYPTPSTPDPPRPPPAAEPDGTHPDSGQAIDRRSTSAAHGAAADLAHTPARLSSLLRHALGLYGASTSGVITVAAAVSVAATVAAAQITDTDTGPDAATDVIAPLAAVTAIGLVATALVYGMSGHRAVERMTTLQRRVLAGLLRPHRARSSASREPHGTAVDPPLARLTTDVHMAEFRASDRLQTNLLGVAATAAFVVVAAVTAPIALLGLLPALGATALLVRHARGPRADAQRLAVAAREPLLLFCEAALATAPTFNHPGARAGLAHWFDQLSDTAFRAGRRSLDIRARLLATVETVAAAVFVSTVVAVLAGAVTTTGVSAATLIYLAYTVTSALAGVVERVQEADALHATLTRVASLTGHTELTIDPATSPATSPLVPRGWGHTDAIRTGDTITVPTVPALVLTVGAPTAMTGPSGAGKSVRMRAAASLTSDHGEPHSVALLEPDVPALGLSIGTLLDPDHRHASEVVAHAWLQAHPPESTPRPLNGSADGLPRDEQQRANLARALLDQPDVLLLDEALSALDSISEREIVQTLTETLPTTAVLVVLHRHDNLDHFHRHLTVHAHSQAPPAA